MFLLALLLVGACGFREEVLWSNAPEGLQRAQSAVQQIFDGSNKQIDKLLQAQVAAPSEATERAIVDFVMVERPEALTQYVLTVAEDLARMGIQGEQDGVSKCEIALVTVLEVWSNIPFAATCMKHSHDFHIALEKIARLWAHLLNDFSCMHEAILFREYPGSTKKKMMLLAMAHAMDLANLRYFDHVEVWSANDRDKSNAADDLPLMDLFETVNYLIREQGTKLLRFVENRDEKGVIQWKQERGMPETVFDEEQDLVLAQSFIIRERVRQLPPDQHKLLRLYDDVLVPVVRRAHEKPSRKRGKSRPVKNEL